MKARLSRLLFRKESYVFVGIIALWDAAEAVWKFVERLVLVNKTFVLPDWIVALDIFMNVAISVILCGLVWNLYTRRFQNSGSNNKER